MVVALFAVQHVVAGAAVQALAAAVTLVVAVGCGGNQAGNVLAGIGIAQEVFSSQRAVGKAELFDTVFTTGKEVVDAHNVAFVVAVYRQMVFFAAEACLIAADACQYDAVAAALVLYPVGAVACGKTVGVVAGAAVEPVVACAAIKGIVAA